MKWVFSGLIAISIIFGIINNSIKEVSNSAIMESENAVKLTLTLVGSMAFWGGIMRVADKAGITSFIAKCFKPIAKLLFVGIDLNGAAFKAITMNLTANLLGLGNAATPLGIDAVKKLAKEENVTDTASQNIIMLVVLNTASIQLLPTTIATMRLSHGASSPLDVLPAILLTSIACVTVGVILVKILEKSYSLKTYSRRKIVNEV